GRDSALAEPSDLITVGNELYFAADDGTHGWELYRSDGTAGGTAMVADLAPPPASSAIATDPADGSYPTDLTDVAGTLYFTASADYGLPLLYSLNTNGQPQIVSSGAQSPQNLTASGNELFFTATDSTHGRELWASDGTPAGTQLVADINPGSTDSQIAGITSLGWGVVFSANDGIDGSELWCSDGTAAGTTMLGTSNQPPNGSSPGDFTAANGKLIFQATGASTGEEPFAVDLPTPPAPTIQVMANATSAAFPAVQGTAPSGATAYLYADGTRVGSTVVGSNGAFAITPSAALPEGQHALVTRYNVDGQLSARSSAVAYTVDSEGAKVKLTSASKSEIDLKFSEDVSASFGRGSFMLIDLDTGERVDPTSLRVTYVRKTNVARITFRNSAGNVLRTGHYRLRLAASKTLDAVGNPLQANASFGITIRKKS
ncbi:MAG: hypothetical protein JO353_08560, partial [Phycisphaerae bacterium]|nr:hypothetical protein [Phycisphaerae bacterium]